MMTDPLRPTGQAIALPGQPEPATAEAGPRKNGKPRSMTAWQISYVRRARRLRRMLTTKAVAHRLGLPHGTVEKYMHEAHEKYALQVARGKRRRS